MKDKTFLGEYLGHSDLVNKLKYSREGLLFHAIVSNSRDSKADLWCLPNSLKILARHRLETVPVTPMGTFSNYDDLCNALEAEFQRVSSLPMAETEEGVVLQLN